MLSVPHSRRSTCGGTASPGGSTASAAACCRSAGGSSDAGPSQDGRSAAAAAAAAAPGWPQKPVRLARGEALSPGRAPASTAKLLRTLARPRLPAGKRQCREDANGWKAATADGGVARRHGTRRAHRGVRAPHWHTAPQEQATRDWTYLSSTPRRKTCLRGPGRPVRTRRGCRGARVPHTNPLLWAGGCRPRASAGQKRPAASGRPTRRTPRRPVRSWWHEVKRDSADC